jgi:Mg2+ and Co2+ transporter CorA
MRLLLTFIAGIYGMNFGADEPAEALRIAASIDELATLHAVRERTRQRTDALREARIVIAFPQRPRRPSPLHSLGDVSRCSARS